MIVAFMLLALALAVIVVSAEAAVRYSLNLGIHFKMPTYLVGFLMIGLGTSAPEWFVAITSSFQDQHDVAVGNVVGSNIANLTLVLGACLLVYPIALSEAVVRKDIPLLILTTFIAIFFVLDGFLSRPEAVALLVGLFLFTLYILLTSLLWRSDDIAYELEDQHLQPSKTWYFDLLKFAASVTALIVASMLLAAQIDTITSLLGWSHLLIGLTLIAIGTTIPELSACLVAAKRKEGLMIVGGLIASNMFNLLMVLPVPVILSGQGVVINVYRDLPFMVAPVLVLMASGALVKPVKSEGRACWVDGTGRLPKSLGVALLGLYGAYIWVLFG